MESADRLSGPVSSLESALRPSITRHVVVLLLALASGCGQGTRTPTGPIFVRNAPAILQMWVTYADTTLGEEPRLVVKAMLGPGLEDGESRSVVDPTLRVMGQSVPVERTEIDHGHGFVTPLFEYEVERAVPSADFRERPMSFDPPALEGVEPDYGPVEWYGVARTGPDTIRLAVGQDLRLGITSPRSIPDAPDLHRGGIVVLEAGGTRVPIRLDDHPEGVVVVDRAVLPEPVDGRIRARLRLTTSRSTPGSIPPDAYHVMPRFAVELAWVVVME